MVTVPARPARGISPAGSGGELRYWDPGTTPVGPISPVVSCG